MPPFSGRLGSDIFEIIAESGQKRFSVHSNILTAQSKPLAAIATRALKEATERKIELLDWDGDTVERFVDFLYLGDYQVPDPEPFIQTEDSAATPSEDLSQEVVYTSDNVRSHSSLSLRSGTTLRGDELVIEPDPPLTPLWQLYESPVADQGQDDKLDRFFYNFDPSKHDYKRALLAHAKLYCLAQYEEVEALKGLTLQRLLKTLMPLRPTESSPHLATNVVQLLKYVYRHTKSPGPASGEEPMRRIVSQFAALNFPALQGTEDMKEVIQEGGELLNDVLNKVCRRLVHTENRLARSQEALSKHEDDAVKLQTEKLRIAAENHKLEDILEAEIEARTKAELYLSEIQTLLTTQKKPTVEEMQRWFMYENIKVVTPNQFRAHRGFDLACWDDAEQLKEQKVYRVLQSTHVWEIVRKVASDLGNLDPSLIRLWVMVNRQNKTIRPEHPLTALEMTIGGVIASYRGRSTYLRLWAEVATGFEFSGIPEQWDTKRSSAWILVFLKHYDAEAQTLRGVGHLYIRRNGLVSDLKPAITSQMGWAPNQPLKLYEEIKPRMIEPLRLDRPIRRAELQNGDIICFQKSYTPKEQLRLLGIGLLPDAKDFYQHLLKTSPPTT